MLHICKKICKKILQVIKMDGTELKAILAKHGVTGQQLANTMGKHPRTVYEWFSKNVIKRTLLQKISSAANIPLSEFFETNVLQEVEAAPYGNKVVHHGFIVKNTIKNKGFKMEAVARDMKITRQTLYSKLADKTWDDGDLYKMANILSVPLGQLKGKGEGIKGFEKDIYDELGEIKNLLKQLLQKL